MYIFVFSRGNIKLHLVDTYPQNSQRKIGEEGRRETRRGKKGRERKTFFLRLHAASGRSAAKRFIKNCF